MSLNRPQLNKKSVALKNLVVGIGLLIVLTFLVIKVFKVRVLDLTWSEAKVTGDFVGANVKKLDFDSHSQGDKIPKANQTSDLVNSAMSGNSEFLNNSSLEAPKTLQNGDLSEVTALTGKHSFAKAFKTPESGRLLYPVTRDSKYKNQSVLELRDAGSGRIVESQVVADHLMVELSEFASEAQLSAFLNSESSKKFNFNLESRGSRKNQFFLKFSSAQSHQTQLVYELAHKSHVFSGVDYDRIVSLTESLPRDAYFNRQWGLKNPGLQNGIDMKKIVWNDPPNMPERVKISPTSGIDIGATLAWDTATDCTKARIAVIDTGVDLTNQELVGNVNVPLSKNFLKGGTSVQDDSDSGHGTHVVGVIAASESPLHVLGSSVGVCWKADIVVLKTLDAQGTGFESDLVEAVFHSIQNGVKIINLSLGTPSASSAFAAAIRSASDAGILIVAASGNDNTDLALKPNYPASFKNSGVIAVGSVNAQGMRSGFSNFSKDFVHISAPGDYIYSTIPKASDTRDGVVDGFEFKEGTSMAAPFVTASLAVFWSREIEMPSFAVKEALLNSASINPVLTSFFQKGRFLNLNALLNSYVFSYVSWAGNSNTMHLSTEANSVNLSAFAGQAGLITGQPFKLSIFVDEKKIAEGTVEDSDSSVNATIVANESKIFKIVVQASSGSSTIISEFKKDLEVIFLPSVLVNLAPDSVIEQGTVLELETSIDKTKDAPVSVNYLVEGNSVGNALVSPFKLSFVPNRSGTLHVQAVINYKDGTSVPTKTIKTNIVENISGLNIHRPKVVTCRLYEQTENRSRFLTHAAMFETAESCSTFCSLQSLQGSFMQPGTSLTFQNPLCESSTGLLFPFEESQCK